MREEGVCNRHSKAVIFNYNPFFALCCALEHQRRPFTIIVMNPKLMANAISHFFLSFQKNINNHHEGSST
jgi:hypothetical protein